MKFPLREFSLLLMLVISVYFYYMFSSIHWESREYILYYYISVAVLYIWYLTVKNLIWIERRSMINAKFILNVFFLQLFLLCLAFFAFSWAQMYLWMGLFLKITWILLCISLLWLLFWGLGRRIIDSIPTMRIGNSIVYNITALALWFSLWVYGVFLLWVLWFLEPMYLCVLFIAYAVLWYKYIVPVYNSLNSPIVSYEHNVSSWVTLSEKNNVSRIIDEVHIILITFLISINFISVYRPFPIWWDDLGAYMNYPKLLASSWELLGFWKMYMWELYTSIWFIFWNQTYAFFLSSFSWVILAGVVYGIIKVLIPESKNQSYNFWFLGVLILLMMPMSIFQLAKDMKIDIWLLFMSLSALVVWYYAIFMTQSSKMGEKYALYILTWFLLWITFSIKVTSLLLILWVFSLLFYSSVWYFWVVGFFLLFSWIFTLGWLWSMMNIIVPLWDYHMMVSVVMLILWVWIISFASRRIKTLKTLIQRSIAITLGIIIGLLPWGIKNIYELHSHDKDITVSRLIGGYFDYFQPEYEKIYSQEELTDIENMWSIWLWNQGITTNADWGRYFWYEEWINNYLKLPWNLSFQTNQAGEFTDITFIFLVLFPLIFLFLPYKNKYTVLVLWIAFTLLILYYIPGIKVSSWGEWVIVQNPFSLWVSSLLSSIILPYGYIVIAALFFVPYYYIIKNVHAEDSRVELVMRLLAFTSIYILLWACSSYWVVWYGIVMYCVILLIIGAILSYNDDNSQKPLLLSWLVLLTVWVYVLQSSIPHWITNLRAAWYAPYKLWQQTWEQAVMAYHPEYFNMLFTINIDPSKREEIFIEYRNKLLKTVEPFENAWNLQSVIRDQEEITGIDRIIKDLLKADIWLLKQSITQLQQSLYSEILFPSEENKSTWITYRSWTFLKYFIADNTTKVYEDGLLEEFEKYLYDPDTSVTTQRLKSLWVSNLLIDLNAATIDQDPEKWLTKRYENVLRYFVDDNLELVETDSICLRVALDTYKVDKDINMYLDIAGVNYWESGRKLTACYTQILQYIQEFKIDDENFSYLKNYEAYIKENLEKERTTQDYIQLLHKAIPQSYKALFEIK